MNGGSMVRRSPVHPCGRFLRSSRRRFRTAEPIRMDEPRKHDCVSPVPGDQGGSEAGPHRLAGPEASLTSSLAAAMESGTVDLRPVVQYLAARVWEAEHQLTRLGRRMDGMRRRVSYLESELSRMAGR